jgi:PAS domain S-box-containing protein
VLTASFNVLMNLLAYLLVYSDSISLPFFPVDAQLLFTHQLNLLLQAIVALLVGAAMTDRESTQVALAVEQVRSAEYEARAHLSSQLLFLNRLLKESNQHLQESEGRFRTSVENMLDCFGIYSAIRDANSQIIDFRIEYVNEAACTNNQLTREEQIGRGLCEILPAHRESNLFEEYCEVVETGQPLVKDALIYEDDYGQQHLIRAFDIRVAKWGDGFVATWRDVTHRRQAEEDLKQTEAALREANERFEFATAAVDCLIYDWRADTNAVERTEGLTELFGYSLDEAEPTADWWGELIHPEDLAQLPRTLEETEFINGRRTLEYRVRHKQGHYIYVEDQCLALFDDQG